MSTFFEKFLRNSPQNHELHGTKAVQVFQVSLHEPLTSQRVFKDKILSLNSNLQFYKFKFLNADLGNCPITYVTKLSIGATLLNATQAYPEVLKLLAAKIANNLLKLIELQKCFIETFSVLSENIAGIDRHRLENNLHSLLLAKYVWSFQVQSSVAEASENLMFKLQTNAIGFNESGYDFKFEIPEEKV